MERQQSLENEPAVKKITDINLATYLTCDDTVNKLPPQKIHKIEKQVGGGRAPNRGGEHRWNEQPKSVFVFLKTDQLDEKVLRFFNKEARVDPSQFSEQFRNLKSYTKQG